MGRAERRRQERAQRIQDRKGKIAISPDELKKMEHETAKRVADFDVECLLTCFAYALRTKYGWGHTRIFRVLHEVDQMFGQVLDGVLDAQDMRQQLEDEVGIRVIRQGEIE